MKMPFVSNKSVHRASLTLKSILWILEYFGFNGRLKTLSQKWYGGTSVGVPNLPSPRSLLSSLLMYILKRARGSQPAYPETTQGRQNYQNFELVCPDATSPRAVSRSSQTR